MALFLLVHTISITNASHDPEIFPNESAKQLQVCDCSNQYGFFATGVAGFDVGKSYKLFTVVNGCNVPESVNGKRHSFDWSGVELDHGFGVLIGWFQHFKYTPFYRLFYTMFHFTLKNILTNYFSGT